MLLVGLLFFSIAVARYASCDPPRPTERDLVPGWCQVEVSRVMTSRSHEEVPRLRKSRGCDGGPRPTSVSVQLRYTYQVDGRKYAGDRFCSVDGFCDGPHDEAMALTMAPGYYAPASGSHVHCFHDRADPRWSTVRVASADEVRASARWRLFWTIAWAVVGLVLVAAGEIRRNQGRRAPPVARLVNDGERERGTID